MRAKKVECPLFCCLVLCGALCIPASGNGENFPIVADVATQGQIERWIGTARPSTQAEHFRTLGDLVERARVMPRDFVRQVIYYTYHMDDQELVPVVYRLFSYGDVAESELAKALGDLLYHEDEKLRSQAWRLWPFVFGRGCQYGNANLSPLRDVLAGKGGPDVAIRLNLRRAAFESSPSSAFYLFHAETSGKELVEMRRLERAISNDLFAKRYLGGLVNGEASADAKAALAALSKSDNWWARMFASEIMVQNKEFRNAELIRKLSSDSHELVRKSASSVDHDDGLRAARVDN